MFLEINTTPIFFNQLVPHRETDLFIAEEYSNWTLQICSDASWLIYFLSAKIPIYLHFWFSLELAVFSSSLLGLSSSPNLPSLEVHVPPYLPDTTGWPAKQRTNGDHVYTLLRHS